jgi:hypothetical protein
MRGLLKRKEIAPRNDLPRNAVGEIMPVLLATTIAIPVSRNGNEKSIASDLSELILRDVITMSAWWLSRAATRPFHRPFCGHRNVIRMLNCGSDRRLVVSSDIETSTAVPIVGF